jgi:2-desacetyl-2-hydroxyethyl bacteriochlorophyllide A dehydrogenase
MRSAVWHGIEDLRIEERPVPTPADDEVVVKVHACGICGTDVHILEGKFPVYDPPRVIGHEYTGTVAAVGKAVTRVKAGDAVAVEPGLCCGKCVFCRQAKENMCLNRFLHPGGMSEYTCVTDRLVHKLPDGVSLDVGALAEPLACCLRAVDMAELPSGCNVLVLGGGSVGLLTASLAAHSGAVQVIVSEPLPHRRAVAKEMGFLAVDPKTEDLPSIVKAKTNGYGPEVVFDCVGHPRLLEQAVELVQKRGTVLEVGVADPALSASISPYKLFEKELTVKASYMRPYTFARAVRWLPVLNLRPLLGVEFPLSQAKQAIHSLREGKGMKILVKP